MTIQTNWPQRNVKGGSRDDDGSTVSPAERWLMITENAYYRAEKRGFVGGNPYQDWVEAEKEIDAQYKMK